ncbi:MAG: hypothetical protein AAF546_00545 [Verrucomicrobiota bacterium]
MAILASTPLKPDSYNQILSNCGGDPKSVFIGICREITERYFVQRSINKPSTAFVQVLLDRVWQAAHTIGTPEPLEPKAMGTPQEPDYELLYLHAQECLNGLPKHRAEDILRELIIQLLVGLTNPEFKACRQSYTSRHAEGCLRQNRDHCAERVSGAHCEDCPYFVVLSKEQHRRLLQRSWADESDDFSINKDIFLPEDFRSLRVFWHLHLRNRRN